MTEGGTMEKINVNNVTETNLSLLNSSSEKKLGTCINLTSQIKDKDNDSQQSFVKMGNNNLQNNETGAAIRSVAVVKKSQVEFPVSFRELQSNTDIKTPPSNWLRGQFSICLPNLTPKRSDFTSFIMGYQFPDCIGEVDIVSDAENIKELLKMAYKPNAHLSMMVHRIGKTILLDEFDIYKYLLRNSQSEWKWLRTFFYEHVLESLTRKEQNVIVRPDKSRDVVQRKNLLSKFLYYSIGEEQVEVDTPKQPPEENPVSVRTFSSPNNEDSIELSVEEHLNDTSVQPFTRNVIWNFEDVRMLIGTDLPIFGGRTHPCVSLRLKDMDKPINILTGIDYWLDNLMCNVPEVIMCYHLNGIVQKYELIKTEDLPHMSDSQFSPQLVRDIAHNILSFLKSKATKEGHTYWLFKGKDDDIVKLYDLTSLCKDDNFESFSSKEEEDPPEKKNTSGINPFTVPVAMLFYCVAKNVWNSKEAVSKLSTIRSLLDNSLNLLNKDKYPKIFCHSHLILADLYLPQDIDPDAPRLLDVSDEELDITKSENRDEIPFSAYSRSARRKSKGSKGSETNSINLDTLCRHHGIGKGSKPKQKVSSDPPKLGRNVYERCNNSIYHVISALEYLVFHSKEDSSNTPNNGNAPPNTSKTNCSEEPKMAKQFEPIPMPYEPLHRKPSSADAVGEETGEKSPSPMTVTPKSHHGVSDKKKSVRKKGKEGSSSCRSQDVILPKTILTGSALNSHLKDASWIDKTCFKFLRKASLIYMTKGRIELNANNYGLCLRHAKLSLRAWCGMINILNPDMDFPLPSQPLLLAGDGYYNLSKRWEQAPSEIENFNNLTKEHKLMNDILEKMAPLEDTRWTIKAPCDNVDAMMLSYKAFETASKVTNSKPDFELKRRLASISNELGCIFMNQADQLCQNLGGGAESGGNLWEESKRFIESAFDIFKEVGDNQNVALLHCNKGRYLRLYAHHNSLSDGEQGFSPAIFKIYDKAIMEYEQALDVLTSKHSTNPQVRESVVWEFSTTLFSYATMMHDYSTEVGDETVLSNIVNLYNKCLNLCNNELKVSRSKEPLYEYRTAVIHIRLASVFHQKYRVSRDSKMMSLAEMHYVKSSERFVRLDSSPADILKVHLDHVVLLEDYMEGMKNVLPKWKAHISILKLLMDCVVGLALIERQKKEKRETEQATKGKRKKGKGKREKKKEAIEEREEAEDETSEKGELLDSLLELLEKKLHGSLLAMLKIAKTDNKSISMYEEDIKEMYVESLNKSSKTLDFHLLQTLMKVSPKIESIKFKFKII